MVTRFQVRKREGRWEVRVLAPLARSWTLLDSFITFDFAMIMATGQDPYGREPRWYRKLDLAMHVNW